MGIDKTRINIERARAALLAALEPEALRAGADIAALVENRIVERGEKAEGGNLTPYSDNAVPAYLYFGRSRNNAGENAVRKKAKERQPVSYKEFRQVNGLNTSPKTLEFTGEMWQGFGPVSVRIIGTGIAEVKIGGRNERTKSLLGYHSEREKTNVTAPSREEIRQVGAGVNARLKAIVENAIL